MIEMTYQREEDEEEKKDVRRMIKRCERGEKYGRDVKV